MNAHPHQAKYPVLCREFNTRFFDPELIASMNECYADCELPLDWSKLSLLEQVKEQIDFIAPPPRSGISVEDENDAAVRHAQAVVAAIEAINTNEGQS